MIYPIYLEKKTNTKKKEKEKENIYIIKMNFPDINTKPFLFITINMKVCIKYVTNLFNLNNYNIHQGIESSTVHISKSSQ